MNTALDKKMVLDQQLDRVQRGVLGIAFSAFIILFTLAQNSGPEFISGIAYNALVSPFALLSLCVLLIAVHRYQYFKSISVEAKNSNQTLRNTLRELSAKANYDELTGFPNKRLLEDRFSEAVTRAKRDKSLVLLYRVTLTDFHSIASNYGSSIGADIIRMTGERLGSILRSTDTVVRLGSCNFVLIIESVDSPEGVAIVNKKIMKKLGRSFTVQGNDPISAREEVTMARYPWDGVTLDALMTAATDKLDNSRTLPRWIDALSDRFTDMSPSQFDFLRDTAS